MVYLNVKLLNELLTSRTTVRIARFAAGEQIDLGSQGHHEPRKNVDLALFTSPLRRFRPRVDEPRGRERPVRASCRVRARRGFARSQREACLPLAAPRPGSSRRPGPLRGDRGTEYASGGRVSGNDIAAGRHRLRNGDGHAKLMKFARGVHVNAGSSHQ